MLGRIFLLSFLFFVHIGYSQNENIAVLDLDPTGISMTEAQFLSDRLRTELFETGVFQVVERQKMNSILKEQGFQNTGCTSLECAVEIGQLLNVQKMVAGSIGKIEDIYSISLRLINVQTGAIIKTATRDYNGRLSEVLTDVIPAVARDLSKGSKTPRTQKKEDKIEKSQQLPFDEPSTNRGFLFLVKGGIASLGYSADISSVQDDLKDLAGFRYDDIGPSSNFGIEVCYVLSDNWAIKLGISQMASLSDGNTSLDGYDAVNAGFVNVHADFERYYIFANTYIGFNYNLWQVGEKSTLYSGLDIGGFSLRTGIMERYKLSDGSTQEYDKEYSYSSIFGIKLVAGYNYQLSNHFSLSAELAFQSAGSFDTSGEERKNLFPIEIDRLIFPGNISVSGIQLNLLVGYNF
jgi:hypothetical protein